MKIYIEIFLVALLLMLMYERPDFLVQFISSTLGKTLTIATIIVLAKTFTF